MCCVAHLNFHIKTFVVVYVGGSGGGLICFGFIFIFILFSVQGEVQEQTVCVKEWEAEWDWRAVIQTYEYIFKRP